MVHSQVRASAFFEAEIDLTQVSTVWQKVLEGLKEKPLISSTMTDSQPLKMELLRELLRLSHSGR
jgi:hypothetical protein